MTRTVVFAALCLFACFGCDGPPRSSAPDLSSSSAELRSNKVLPSNDRLDDLHTEINSDVIMDLPGLLRFERQAPDDSPPTHRIVHICDWHLVPQDDFAADLHSHESLSEDQIAARYKDFLDEVEDVQLEQIELLRELIKNHGIERVFVEGLTDEDMPIFEAQIRAMRKVEAQLGETERERDLALDEIAKLEQAGEQDGEQYLLEVQLVAAIDGLLQRHRLDLLRFGAAGRLYLAGELAAVEALDDAEALARSKPRTVGGQLQVDVASEEREDAQVRRMIERGPFAVAILGGGHNLSDNLQKLTNGKGEYISIITESYAKHAME